MHIDSEQAHCISLCSVGYAYIAGAMERLWVVYTDIPRKVIVYPVTMVTL